MAYSDDFLSPRDHCEICGVELEDEIVIQEFADGSLARLCPECAAGAALNDVREYEAPVDDAPPRKRRLFSRGRGAATQAAPDEAEGEAAYQREAETQGGADAWTHAVFDLESAGEPAPVAPAAAPAPAAPARFAAPAPSHEPIPAATYDAVEVEQDILDKTRELLMPVADLIALQGEMQSALERLAASLEQFTAEMLVDAHGKTTVINTRLQALERELEITRTRLRETESLLPAPAASEPAPPAEPILRPEEVAPITLDSLVAESRAATAATAKPAEASIKAGSDQAQAATALGTEAGAAESKPAPLGLPETLPWTAEPAKIPSETTRPAADEAESAWAEADESESEWPVAGEARAGRRGGGKRAAARAEKAEAKKLAAERLEAERLEAERLEAEAVRPRPVRARPASPRPASPEPVSAELEGAAPQQPEPAEPARSSSARAATAKPTPAEPEVVPWQPLKPLAPDAQITGTFAISEVQAAQRYYNESSFVDRIRDVRRSLGRPKASLVRLAGQEQQAILTIFWDIVWYQYLIDLRRDLPPSAPRIVLHREGMDLDELAFHFRDKNSTVNDDGRLDASELEVHLLSDPSTLITEMTPEETQVLEDATEEIWEQRISPEFKWDD